ncbi:MAG: oligopeptide ABC transporter permease [Bacillota bacterium]
MRTEQPNTGLFMISSDTFQESYWYPVIRRFLKHKLAFTGLMLILGLILVAILAPYLSPYSPYEMNVTAFSAPPSADHWLGTDSVGRDILSRLIYASRISLAVGIGSVALNVIIGVLLGSTAGFLGGGVDSVIMRITEMLLSFPPLMIILVLVSLLGPGLFNIILVLGLLSWPRICRLIRAEVISIKNQEYITAAKAIGSRDLRILFIHLIPNAFPPVLVAATFGAARAIIIEASLSFLGMGVQPPTASWGNMLNDAQSMGVLSSMPWIWVPPGVLIVIVVLSINFVGDGMRDALDPKLRS